MLKQNKDEEGEYREGRKKVADIAESKISRSYTLKYECRVRNYKQVLLKYVRSFMIDIKKETPVFL